MLTLPATPARLLHDVIVPALAGMPPVFDSPAARCMLLAIALQEGGALLAGRQALRRQGAQLRPRRLGPARSFWQNERSSIRAVMTDPRTDDLAARLLEAAAFPHDSAAVHARLERADADLVACQLNRLLLYLDPRPLPAPVRGNALVAFEYYVRNWRPGAVRTAAGRTGAFRRWRAQWPTAVALTAGQVPPS